jgi:predicted ATPase/class 3 adenylate cyclase
MTEFSERGSQILTFLYTDIEGSTRLWEEHPNRVEAAIARHDEILRGSVKKLEGSVFRSVGDGLCAVFVNPSHAVAAALDAQLALKAEDWGEIGELRVRMAIHTGEVETLGSDFSGRSLNRIGRLLSITHGGQVLVSNTTQLLMQNSLPGGADLLDLGKIRLRDLSQPEHVFQLVHPKLPGDFPPLTSLDRRPNNLPTQPTPLIGRQTELAEILNLLGSDQVRMLTLTGPGGTGKTRLGLQAAAELVDCFKNGVYFVDLASIRDPEAVLPAIGRTIGVRGTNYRPIQDELKEQLRSNETFLVLDNVEQVTAAAPQLVELLQDAPHLKMLVTSRERLHVRPEHVFQVPPLGLPKTGSKQLPIEQLIQYEAIRLFVERAQAVKPDFKLTDENAQAVTEICIRLDGLPLAIELAASRIRLFSPQALLERLGNRLKLLKGGARDLPTRQQTLKGAISWSYDLLDGPGKRLFELLSVCRGGCTIETVEEVAGMVDRVVETEVDVVDGLASLVDKSLVRQREVNGEPRFLMLETILEYATKQLGEDSDFKTSANRAHARHFADFSMRGWKNLTGESLEAALEEIEVELENIRAAWNYWVAENDLEQLEKIKDSLYLLYDARGWYHAMVDLTNDLLEILSLEPPSIERGRQEIVLLTNLASALLITKGYISIEVEQTYTRTLKLIEEQGEIPQFFPVLRGLARYYTYRGDYEKAMKIGEQILDLGERLDDPDMKVVGHLGLGTGYSFTKSLTKALDHLEKGIENYNPDQNSFRSYLFGNDPGIACIITSTLVLWMLGLPDKAISRAKEAVALAKKLNHPFSIAYTLFHTGLLHLWTGKIDQAEDYSLLLKEMADEYEFYIWTAVGASLHGAAQVRSGRVEEGLAQIQWGMETYQGLKTPPVFWPLLIFNQAEAYLQAGRPEEGLALLSQLMKSADPIEGGALLCEFLRLQGDLLLAVSKENAGEAENLFISALEMAKEHKANMLALRAAIRLANLWREQDKSEQSRQLLSEYYQEMTEGFSLPDPMEARALLEKQL